VRFSAVFHFLSVLLICVPKYVQKHQPTDKNGNFEESVNEKHDGVGTHTTFQRDILNIFVGYNGIMSSRISVPANIKASIKLVSKTLNEGLSVYAYPVSVTKTRDIPKEIHQWLDQFLKQRPETEVFGSLAMTSYAPHGRSPGDLDAVVDNPQHVANMIVQRLRQHGYKAKADPHPWKGGWQVKYRDASGQDVIIADLHAKGGHNVQFTEYGFSKKPSKVHGMLIQEAEDQLLRKANSILSKEGVGAHRIAKDMEDFVVIANTMLDSKELRAEAKLEKVKQAKRELKKIIEHAKKIKGTNAKRMNADPIPDTMEKKVIAYAKKNPDVDVRDIVIMPNRITHTMRVPKRNPPETARRYPKAEDKLTSGKPRTIKTQFFSWQI